MVDTVTYRTTDNTRWGTGKGSNLTPTEVDINFWALVERVTTLEDDPPQAVSIAGFEVTGDQMTILMTDSSTRGPYTLPTPSLRWLGDWQPNTTYFVDDIVSYQGNIYIITANHTSADTFDPTLFMSPEGYVYRLILSRPTQPYDVGFYYGDQLPGDGSQLFKHVACRPLTLPSGFLGCQAYLSVATTNTITLEILHNGSIIGYIDFIADSNLAINGDGGQYGVFTQLSPDQVIDVAQGDLISVKAPTATPNSANADPTASRLSVTMRGLA